MIVILGASGFIGTYLADELTRQGEAIIACGRNAAAKAFFTDKGIAWADIDISNARDFDTLPRKGVDAVVLLSAMVPANVGDYDPRRYVDVNVMGTLNALEYTREAGARKFINTASHRDVQNHWSQTRPLSAETARSFKYTGDHVMYIISKVAAAECVEHYRQEYGIAGMTFRLPGVYGYGPHLTAFIDGKLVDTGLLTFIKRAMAGRPIEVYGDADAGKDLVYVKDAVDAYIGALRSDRAQGVYNIATGRVHTLREMAEAVSSVFSPTGVRAPVVVRPEKPNNFRPCLYDIGKASCDFGFFPRFLTFEAMMQDLRSEMDARRFPHLIERLDKFV